MVNLFTRFKIYAQEMVNLFTRFKIYAKKMVNLFTRFKLYAQEMVNLFNYFKIDFNASLLHRQEIMVKPRHGPMSIGIKTIS